MLAEADYSMTDFAMRSSGMNPDDRLMVKFYYEPVQNMEKTTLEGRPIFEDKEYIEIRIPGVTENVVCRPVWKPNDLERFPRQWAAFKNKGEQTQAGTPLKMWPLLTQAQIKEFEALNIVTVEQLANVSDSSSHRIMGLQRFKQQASDFLEAARGMAPMVALRDEVVKKDAQIEVLNNNLKEISERLAALEKAKK
jgi:hypothetical protein